jgi:hypothetical protein
LCQDNPNAQREAANWIAGREEQLKVLLKKHDALPGQSGQA